MISEQIKNKKLRCSQFTSLVRTKPPILYHSILMSLDRLNEEEHEAYQLLLEKPSSIRELAQINPIIEKSLESLAMRGIIVAEGIQESEVYKKLLSPDLETNFTLLYLLLTDSCNLKCRYCFEENNQPTNFCRKTMTEEVMKWGIDLFAKNCSKILTASRIMYLYGGEPLFNSVVALKSIDYAEEQYPQLRINPQLITNGTLIDEFLASELASRKVNISVSLDGTKIANDSARVFKSGQGSFEESVRGYNLLKSAGCKNLSISLTIGSHNALDLKKNVEYLVNELNPSGFGFNFLIGPNEQLGDLYVDMDETTNQVIDTFKFLKERGIFEDRMMRKVRAFVKRKIHLKDCGGVGNQIVISPDGYVGPCQAFASSKKYFRPIIDLEGKDLTKDETFKKWNNRYPLNIPQCLDCIALGVCGGGCPYHSYLTKGSIEELDERMCKHNKKILNWLIQETINLKDDTKS